MNLYTVTIATKKIDVRANGPMDAVRRLGLETAAVQVCSHLANDVHYFRVRRGEVVETGMPR